MYTLNFTTLKTIAKICLFALAGLLLAGVIVLKIIGVQAYVVTSDSMAPKITKGGLIIISPVKKYAVDDIVLYYYQNNSQHKVTHRIISKKIINNGNFFTTQGDNNSAPDFPLVAEKEIVGKVIYFIPVLGKFYDTKLGYAALFAGCGMLFGKFTTKLLFLQFVT